MHITEILCTDYKELEAELDMKFNLPSRKEENERMDRLYEELTARGPQIQRVFEVPE